MSKKRERVEVSGAWIPLPIELVRSRAFAELSPHAAKLFFDLVAQLGSNAFRNGDLTATPAVMRTRGWTSRATLGAATKELEDVGLLIQTRFGDKRKCSLYALTPWPLHCDLDKLDVRPGCYSRTEWATKEGQQKPPTSERPARWRSVRKNKLRRPVAEQQATLMPRHGTAGTVTAAILPRSGALSANSAASPVPPRVTYLDMPSPTVQREAEGVAL
jgi:hypothetical protein